ncbi:MAG: type II secretion system protein GspG [Lentisphaeraceae bacterium]|nr:type II secretion system protein GspG [Lentisphaeraceae bacterium]
MSENKTNWIVSIGFAVALGLAALVILKTRLRDGNEREHYKVLLDLKLIKQAVEQYNLAHGSYPLQSKDRILNFAEQLAEEMPSKDLKESRTMFVDYQSNLVTVSNDNYAAPNADPTNIIDSWGEPYMYISDGKTFTVWSTGPDKVNSNGNGDDISQINIERPKNLKTKKEK